MELRGAAGDDPLIAEITAPSGADLAARIQLMPS